VYIIKEVTKTTITAKKKIHAQKLMQLTKFCPHLNLPAIEVGAYDLFLGCIIKFKANMFSCLWTMEEK